MEWGIYVKRVKRRSIFWSIFAGVLVIFAIVIAVDCYQNPLNGTTYSLIKVSKDDISEVQIQHYGKTVVVSDPSTVKRLVELFDCDINRVCNDYFNFTTGGMEWGLVFCTNDTESVRLAFSPSITTQEKAMYKIGDYYYHCNKAIDNSLVHELWNQEGKE